MTCLQKPVYQDLLTSQTGRKHVATGYLLDAGSGEPTHHPWYEDRWLPPSGLGLLGREASSAQRTGRELHVCVCVCVWGGGGGGGGGRGRYLP